jgi:excisionase family DNA binding protein
MILQVQSVLSTKRKEVTVMDDSVHNVPSQKTETYRVEDIAKILDISRSSAYALVRKGHFKSVHIGTSIRISQKSFDQWLNCQTD